MTMQEHSTTGRPAEGPEALLGTTHPAFTVIRRVFITLAVVVVVVVVGLGVALWSATGGIDYHANDWTVRNARRTADAKARPAVDQVAADLAPALGQPARRAMVDTCYESSQIFVNGLTCKRSLFLYYPLVSEVPHALDVARPISTTLWPSKDDSCRWGLGVTRACRETPQAKLVVQVNGANADPNDRFPPGMDSMVVVEQEGRSDLVTAIASGPCVIVAYTTTYFSD
jgi:hypothetical protein